MPIFSATTDAAFTRSPERSRGTVLLLALLVMSSVVITSAGLGSLILSSLQQTKAIDNAIVAFYAAESGIEDAVYRARRLEEFPAGVSDRDFGGGTKWSRTVTTSEPVIYASVPENSLLEVALYDPDNEQLLLDIDSVRVTWDPCEAAVCPLLYATVVGWQPSNPIVWDPNAATYRFNASPATLSVGGGKLYKLRLRAEKGDLKNVRIQAFDDQGRTGPPDLPGRLHVEATGEHAGTRQKLTVSLPRRIPLSSIYDFVVFSECSLVKGGAVSCPVD